MGHKVDRMSKLIQPIDSLTSLISLLGLINTIVCYLICIISGVPVQNVLVGNGPMA